MGSLTGILKLNSMAGIEYSGMPGISASCLRAVERLLQAGERIQLAVILSAENRHGLLLHMELGGSIAVKTGFTSGYSGEGPSTFARTLQMLKAFDVEMEEIEVSVSLLHRLDRSALNAADLALIGKRDWIRPWRLADYIYTQTKIVNDKVPPLARMPVSMPWGLLDHRLLDLAKGFETNPDYALLTGFRRLEDLVRAKLDKDAPEGRVFATAFSGDRSQLCWHELSAGEHTGRAQLFTGAYSAFRNPRAHKEIEATEHELLQQFLLLNLLFKLEGSAIRRPPLEEDASGANERASRKIP